MKYLNQAKYPKKKKTEEDKIKKILKAPQEENNSGIKEGGSSVENSILKKIRK